MNNKIIIGIVVLVIILGGIYLVISSGKMQSQSLQAPSTTQTGTSPVASKNAVTIQGFAFSPATLTVKVGDTVTWTNQDSTSHTVTADDNSFDTGAIDQGKSASNTFTKAGTYAYHCSIHPSMTGTIIVE